VRKVGPVITDNGNFVIDATFGLISRPNELERKLKSLTGIVETGLFIKMAKTIYIGKHSGVETLTAK
jgi:ribose 5-phosphate isomerase A